MKVIKSKCGLFGVYSKKKISLKKCVNSLEKLQHRGRESCGISFVKNKKIITQKSFGLVENLKKITDDININICIGHVRYSTSGSKCDSDVIQPLQSNDFSISHNGNIPNINELKKKIKIDNKNINDTGVLKYIIETSVSIIDGLKYILSNIKCSYCLLIMTQSEIYCMRDPYGFKPLSIGEIDNGWIITSESIAHDNITVDVKPGELVRINKDGPQIIFTHCINPLHRRICSFEFIYFMNYKTIADGLSVKAIRNQVGKLLAKEDKNIYPENTIVFGAPNSGIEYGIGYASEKGIKYIQIVEKIKRKRSFILPTNKERNKSIKSNIIFKDDLIDGNEIIVVDDSIVRGNTTKNYIKKLKEYGAKKVHIKSAFPKIISPCYYGLDFPTYGELIGSGNTDEKIKEMIMADSLQFSKISSIQKLIKPKSGNICVSCLTDEHDSDLLDWYFIKKINKFF